MSSDKTPLPFGYTFAAGESLPSFLRFEASTSSGCAIDTRVANTTD